MFALVLSYQFFFSLQHLNAHFVIFVMQNSKQLILIKKILIQKKERKLASVCMCLSEKLPLALAMAMNSASLKKTYFAKKLSCSLEFISTEEYIYIFFFFHKALSMC